MLFPSLLWDRSVEEFDKVPHTTCAAPEKNLQLEILMEAETARWQLRLPVCWLSPRDRRRAGTSGTLRTLTTARLCLRPHGAADAPAPTAPPLRSSRRRRGLGNVLPSQTDTGTAQIPFRLRASARNRRARSPLGRARAAAANWGKNPPRSDFWVFPSSSGACRAP